MALNDILPVGIDPQQMQMRPQGPGPLSSGQMAPNPQTAPKQKTPAGINPALEDRFVALREAIRKQGGDIYIFSGARTPEEQKQLLDQAVAKYGDVKEAMKRVKAPGKSSHDPSYGVAMGLGEGALGVDVRGDLHLAHKLGPHFGLVFPSTTQPWHMEFAGVDKIKT